MMLGDKTVPIPEPLPHLNLVESSLDILRLRAGLALTCMTAGAVGPREGASQSTCPCCQHTVGDRHRGSLYPNRPDHT